MQLLAVVLVAAIVSATAMPEPPLVMVLVKRAEAEGEPLFVEELDTTTATAETLFVEDLSSSSATTDPLITDAPDAAALRLNDVDDGASPPCTPSSICFDGRTCGVRYGGCYDKNFCTGTTSFPMPTVTCDPAAGLMQNLPQQMGAAPAPVPVVAIE